MWSATLRTPPVRCIRAPGRALASSFTRGRPSPQGPRNGVRRPERISSAGRENAQPEQPESSNLEASQPNITNYDPSLNTLLAPVHIPEDPNAVLKERHPATGILVNSGLVVQRQLEMMNVMIGFEQANKYVIMDANGNHIGYMAEQENGMANMMARQWFRTHRSFVTHVFDRHENEVLRGASTESLVQASGESGARVSPFGVEDMRVIGETQQQWAPLRRKYNLFTYHHSPEPATDMGAQSRPLSASGLSQAQQMQLTRSGQSGQEQGEFNQFAYVDEPFLSWDFALRSADYRLIGSVNRDFAGFGRELFTDTGVYALRMDSAKEPTGTEKQLSTGMTLDQRAVMLASAVSVDFDYFSRHSGSGGFGFMPMWIPGMGGDAAAGGAAAGEAGTIGETAAGTAGRAGAAGGMAEGVGAGAAGAGTMAGYEAMQRGMSGDPNAQGSASEQQPPASMDQQPPPPPGQTGPYGDVWAEEQHQDTWGQDAEDPWSAGDDDGDDGGDGFDLF